MAKKKAKSKTKTPKTKIKETMRIVLEGGIFIETLQNGKIVERDEIEGKVVLELILAVLTRHLRELDDAKG